MHFELLNATEILARTPAIFRALMDGLSDVWVMPNDGPETRLRANNLCWIGSACASGF